MIQALLWLAKYIHASFHKTFLSVSLFSGFAPCCSLSTSPVKSGRALSSTRRRGRTCFCSRRFLAAVRDVKISFSAISKPSFVSLSSRSLLHSFVVLVTNRIVTGALRNLMDEEQRHFCHGVLHIYIHLMAFGNWKKECLSKGCRWKDCIHLKLLVLSSEETRLLVSVQNGGPCETDGKSYSYLAQDQDIPALLLPGKGWRKMVILNSILTAISSTSPFNCK